jgi:tRNA(Ile)-lysidine synthase
LHDAEHVEDSTNATTDYQRNKFRNEIIPLLSEINPSVRQTLYDTLERFEGSLAIYQQAIDEMEKKIVDKTGSGLVIMNIDLIKQQAHIPTVLFELLHPYGFSPAIIEQISGQLDGESGKVFHADAYKLVKDRNSLIISAKGIESNEFFSVSQTDKRLEIPFPLTINKQQIISGFRVSKGQNRIHVDASKLVFPLQIRKWKEGDFFYPFGMKQRKKISDFFIDNKLSLIDKEKIWLLVSGDEIVWIVGLRMDNRFRVTDQTTEVVEFEI